MKIGISINEVLRATIEQYIYVYEKYVEETSLEDFSSKAFNENEFNKTFNSFLYDEASLEIFGHADQLHDGLIREFNNFLIDIYDDEEHQVELVSKEFNKSIPATFFFLSKTACKIRNIRFVTHDIDEWGDLDVLITANPNALKNKPDGKISIKIMAFYNEMIESDFTYETIIDFFNDKEILNKINKNKIEVL